MFSYNQKAWEFAKSPLGQIPMFLFIMWMTGSSLSIYTIMFTVSFATKPFSSILSVEKSFKMFRHKDLNLILPKLAFIAANMIIICMAAYKFSNLGIIPVQPADWAGLLSPRTPIESNVVIIQDDP